MQNGLYVATSGLLMQEERLNVISNNLANVNTTGFKKELALFSDYRPVDKRFPQNYIQKSYYNRTINSSVKLDDITTDFVHGPFKSTDNTFDLAIEDENNFFTVETPFGVRFTKDGSFTLNSQGELVTHDGFNVLDTAGNPIIIPQGAQSVEFLRDGNILIDGAQVATLSVARFEDLEYLQKIGRNLYAAVDTLPQVPDFAGVRQGFLEMSNVEPVMEMVRMIEALRGFEMYQKAVHTYDSMNEKAANDIARI